MTAPTSAVAEVAYEPADNDRRSTRVERLAAQYAQDRGGQTHPLSGYDLDRAEEALTGEKNIRAENVRLKAEVKRLRALLLKDQE